MDEGRALPLPWSDVGQLLRQSNWRTVVAEAEGTTIAMDHLEYVAPVPAPGKIVCVGLNYRNHIVEMGRDLPTHPTLFAKFAESLIGPCDDIVLPRDSEAVDWEGELAVVIGSAVRHANQEAAEAAIAGYTVLNDVTARDFQYHTTQWLQGKTFEATTPMGPEIVTPDEFEIQEAEIVTELDGEEVQRAGFGELVFGPTALIRFISSIITLQPGDVIATGTPGGVGHARTPARYLQPGSRLVTRVDGLGQLENTCRPESRP